MPAHVTAADADRHPPRGASTQVAGAMMYLSAADTVAWLAGGAGNALRFLQMNAGGTAPAWVAQTAIDHGSIGGLADDDHTGYARLVGRAGGQTLQGGTAASENLTLESTAHATKGQVRVLASLAGAQAFRVWDGSTDFISVTRTAGTESVVIGNSTTGEIGVGNQATGENAGWFNSVSNSDGRRIWKTGTGATPADGSTLDLITIAIPNDFAGWIDVEAMARESGAGTASRRFKIEVQFENDSGTAAILGAAITNTSQGDSLGTGSPGVAVVYSGANVIVRATASSSLLLNWAAWAEYGVVRGS